MLVVHGTQHVIINYAKSLVHHLKIATPRKTPDTTSVSDDRLWHAESWSSMREQPPPSISKPKEPMARCTHPGYLRELTSDPIIPHPDRVQLCVLSSARPPNPRTVPLALKCETCIDYLTPPLRLLSPHTCLRGDIRLQLHHRCYTQNTSALTKTQSGHRSSCQKHKSLGILYRHHKPI